MRHLKEFVKPMDVNGTCIGFTNFFRCLIFNCKKEKLKDKISKKFLKPMEVKSRRKLCPKWLTGFSFSIFNFKYETTVRSSAWSYGHSDPDPDPSSVSRVPF